MKSHARVVVIGGGIAGCSVLYHLVKLGWTDVALIERQELTSGSTWHAAGNTPHFEVSRNLARIQKYSTELYERLEAETGQPTGFHRCGSIRIAAEPGRVDQFRRLAAQARTIDLAFEVIGPNEVRHHLPFMEVGDVLAGAYTPMDGYTDPSSTTNALAKGARAGGAEIHRHRAVTGVQRLPTGEWQVRTDGGTITAEHVVNAAGTWAREIAAMTGIDLPIVSMEHQYLVTEPMEAVRALGREFPLLRDPMASFYLRQEGMGMLLGPYERGARAWGVDGIPPDFRDDLLPPDLDRIESIVGMAMARVPALGEVGIRKTVNGPIPHTPDGNPLIGPVAGQRGYWCCNGFSVGIAQGGGAGRALAEWIVAAEPEMDMAEFDPRRFGPWAGVEYTVARSIETYERMYDVGYPNEPWAGGRPLRASPLYHRLKARGAVMEPKAGWERAAWFAPAGTKAENLGTFRRDNSFAHVAAESRAVRERAGLLDLSAFAKFEVTGPGAAMALDRLMANRLPREGRIGLSQFLTGRGRIAGEATIARLAADSFYVVTAAAAREHDRDWLEDAALGVPGVDVADVTERLGCLVLAGPKAREVLAACTRADLSNESFPWLSVREIALGFAPVRALRMTYVGELGWELHMPVEHLPAAYDRLMEAGEAHGIADFGTRAMDSLRLEKGYRAFGGDLTMDVTPLEAGLGRLVKPPAEGGYQGAEGLAAADGSGWRFVICEVDAGDADAPPNAPVTKDGRAVGITSSGGYGHFVGKSIAFAYVEPACAAPGTRLEIDILGEARLATVCEGPLYDPENRRPRG